MLKKQFPKLKISRCLKQKSSPGAQEWVLYVTDFDNQVHLAISQNLRTFWDHIASGVLEDHN